MNTAKAIRPMRALVVLAISASLLLAAIGLSVTRQIVRDPENPAYVGNTIGASTTTSGPQIVRDPENPAYVGNTIGSYTTTSGPQIVRDPENPYWAGATQGRR